MFKIMTADEAVKEFVFDGATVAFGGFVGSGHPEGVTLAISEAFKANNTPKNLTIMYAAG